MNRFQIGFPNQESLPKTNSAFFRFQTAQIYATDLHYYLRYE
jgi:hypothetical protein